MTRRFREDRLLVATHNAGKLEEIADLLAPYGVAVTSAQAHGLAVPEETEPDFEGNARLKARAAAQATGLAALSDDSGLEVAVLDGAPGVNTADWAETGAGRDFGMAMRRVHDALIVAGAEEPWRARFCCALALVWPDGAETVVLGTAPGRIVWPMRGEHGHGYDPIFLPDGHDRTFAEMDRWAKNRLSHRADAFNQLIEKCFADDATGT